MVIWDTIYESIIYYNMSLPVNIPQIMCITLNIKMTGKISLSGFFQIKKEGV